VVAWDRGATLADRFRAHAGEEDHLYAHAMRGMAQDWEAGGVVREICAGHEEAPEGSALQLRLLAGVFRLVLTGAAPELVRFYPCLGGTEPPSGVWPVMREVLEAYVETGRAALEIAPQTNEVGRSAALLIGLLDLVAASGVRRIRLLELGASAGLNLLVDRFRITGDGWQWGPADSGVQLEQAVVGEVRLEPVLITDRRGCDLSPIDAGTPEGRLLLTSFVWPFDLHRHARLAGALAVVAQHPVTVDRAGAGPWLAEQLGRTEAGVLPVVWQSITQLYWPASEVARVRAELTAYGRQDPVGRVGLEYDPGGDPTALPELRIELWGPGQPPQERLLGTAHPHGVPVRLAAQVQ